MSSFLARQEWKVVYIVLADPLGLGISSRDRNLGRQTTQGNPGASFKNATLSVSLNPRCKHAEIQYTLVEVAIASVGSSRVLVLSFASNIPRFRFTGPEVPM